MSVLYAKAADSDKLKLRETRVTMPVRGLFLSRETCADSQSLVMARSGLGHLGTHGFAKNRTSRTDAEKWEGVQEGARSYQVP